MPNKYILGTFEGECADANITNLNGLDINKEVWENVFASDDFKQGIELGWFIGYLGHPEDPNCMEFKNGCIVMTEGHIDDDGKVYGKFNLIDTPVGRTVKTFIDAGVKFGISVRGAGDIVDNSVVPGEFIFRGFDLVSFPAYPESIPEFSEIAASTDPSKRETYKKICAAVDSNIDDIDDINALHVIKSQFAKQSDQYKLIESKIAKLNGEPDEGCEGCEDILNQKLEAMTNLYLDAVEANKQLQCKLNSVTICANKQSHDLRRQVRSLSRISADQLREINKDKTVLANKYKLVVKANTKLKSEVIEANSNNLKYKRKLETDIRSKDKIIASLQSKLSETVTKSQAIQASTSNLGAKNKQLEAKIEELQCIVAEYQNAYAGIYANAIGVKLPNMSISSSTSVKGLQSIIANTQISQNTQYMKPDIEDIEDIDDDSIVTL